MQNSSKTKRMDILSILTLGVALLLTVMGVMMALRSSPDASQGYFIRMFQIHPPIAWVGFLAVFASLAYSIFYLATGQLRHDRMAAACMESGLLFMALTLLTGMFWGKATWGTYWQWEPRLTTSALSFVILAGYFVVRSAIEDPDFRAKASAGVAILGSINVPITYMSVYWWRSIHQAPTFDMTTGESKAPFELVLPMLINMLAFTVLFLALIRIRGVIAGRSAKREEAALER